MTKCKIIVVFNHKGGVGKTTTAVNLAAGLAHSHSKRVLVVDMDPQANATWALLPKKLPPDQETISQVLLGASSLQKILMRTSIPSLHIGPADLGLSEAEFKLTATANREWLLQRCLRPFVSLFDYVIIDCAPSLGLLSLNGLAAADQVLIPCETQFLSLRGLHYVLDLVNMVRVRLSPSLNVLGVLATKFHVISRANNEALECLRNLNDVRVFKSVIPRDVKAEEAPSHGKPIILYAPESRAAREYVKFTDEVIRICQN